MMNILSNALYSDKILAVCREVLCNAWDIHIQTGRTDTPVEVSLHQGKLTIRDFGTGISKDDIHPIYAVYGNSTKKNDGKQTGGFGLGSKSPFAYVDHFEVTSIFEGEKTVYAISKSSAEVSGKPSITPLVTVPSTEPSGLAVSLNIQELDRNTFRETIETIARFGEMNVIFNGSAIPTLPFSESSEGFLITSNLKGLSGSNNYKIFIRYGNVVYPLESHLEFNSFYRQITDILQHMSDPNSYHGETWKIIFQAEPDSISITPSRESLSMTDHTVKNVKMLLEKFLTSYNKQVAESCFRIAEKHIKSLYDLKPKVVAGSDIPHFQIPAKLMDFQGITTLAITRGFNIPEFEPKKVLTSFDEIAVVNLNHRYPKDTRFRQKDITQRIQYLEHIAMGGAKNRGKLQSFLRYSNSLTADARNTSTWFQRALVQPLIRKIQENPEVDHKKLFIYGKHRDITGNRYSYSTDTRFVDPNKLSPRRHIDYLPFLRNIIVLSFNRTDVEERLPFFPIMERQLIKSSDFFVYIVSRTDARVVAARKFFTDQGMTLIDLTQPGEHEEKTIIEPKKVVSSVPVRPRKKGLPTFKSMLVTQVNGIDQRLDHTRLRPADSRSETLPRIEKPEFLIKINPRPDIVLPIDWMDGNQNILVAQIWGDVCGIAINDNQFCRYRDEFKIPLAIDWISDKILHEAINNPRIQDALALSHSWGHELAKINLPWTEGHKRLFETIVTNSSLASEFGIINPMIDQDRKIIQFINGFNTRYNIIHNKASYKAMNEHILATKPKDELIELAVKISKSQFIEFLDAHSLSDVFVEPTSPNDKKQQENVIKLLKYALA